jgi:hypothetical protein
MKLPAAVLSSVRGPLVVLALAGCQAPARIEPEPAPVPPAPSVVETPPLAPIDPVTYQASTEEVRLARADDLEMRDDARRTRRIAAARPRTITHTPVLGTIGVGHSWYGAGCGRG